MCIALCEFNSIYWIIAHSIEFKIKLNKFRDICTSREGFMGHRDEEFNLGTYPMISGRLVTLNMSHETNMC